MKWVNSQQVLGRTCRNYVPMVLIMDAACRLEVFNENGGWVLCWFLVLADFGFSSLIQSKDKMGKEGEYWQYFPQRDMSGSQFLHYCFQSMGPFTANHRRADTSLSSDNSTSPEQETAEKGANRRQLRRGLTGDNEQVLYQRCRASYQRMGGRKTIWLSRGTLIPQESANIISNVS